MSFRNLTSESPSFPKAKVPRYPMTMVPAAPVNPVRSEAQGLLAHSGVKAFQYEGPSIKRRQQFKGGKG